LNAAPGLTVVRGNGGSAAAPPQRIHRSERIAHAALALVALALTIFLAGPLAAITVQAFETADGGFAGIANFVAYARTPALATSLINSLWVAALVTVIVVPAAFVFAYALTRTRMRFRRVARAITLIPLLAPSLLAAISLIYWFGNQGVAKGLLNALGIDSIYGAPGIVIAEVFATFPHVLMILVTALAATDARLFEAAQAMGTSAARRFWTITLPGARYGLISSALVGFTLVITDFGIPKVIGGNFDMLATDIFKLVIGQQDFQRGAVVALLLLAPAVLSFGVDHWLQRRQVALLSAQAVPYRPRSSRLRDTCFAVAAWLMCAAMLALLIMAVVASLVTFWPYDLRLSWRHYALGLHDAEVGDAFVNSAALGLGTAVFGTAIVFLGAYLIEKSRGANSIRSLTRLLAMLPMAVPGLVLGLGTIIFFNAAANPLHGIYRTLTLLIACTIVHFYTTSHLTAVTALKSLDPEFEAVAASLKVAWYRTFWRVTLPLCSPALVDIARYFFINATTTVSAVVFLYSPETKVASIAILNLDEAGEIGAAAACAVMIAAGNVAASLVFMALGAWTERRTQAWKGVG
jgi:iron(III) transport system permease protein